MKTYWGKKGKSISIPCSLTVADDEENFALEWRKDKKLIFSSYSLEKGHAAPNFQGRVARGHGLSLTIHSVMHDDSGVYTCAVTRYSKQPTKPEFGDSVRLIVNVMPTISNPIEQVLFRSLGSTLNIECKANGAPSPEITWSKDDEIVSSNAFLRIESLNEWNKGKYTCLAVNVEGKASTTVELKFSKDILFDFIPTNKTVIEGSNVFWHCHANAQPERIRYTWSFQQKPVKTTQTGLRAEIKDGDLSLRDVRKEDRGWYFCEASNSRHDVAQTAVYLDVLYAPEALPSHKQVLTAGVGSNVTLSCDVTANPGPSLYTWSRNGHFLVSHTEKSYNITSTRHDDGGIYGCVAENAVGEGQIMETHLIVAEPPVFTTTPPDEFHAREGSKVEIPCEAFGDPQPIVYWTHNKNRISSNVLEFETINSSDHGLYQCVVNNAVSTLTKSLYLVVESSKPQPATITAIECESPTSLKVKWAPGFDGSFLQSFAVYYAPVDSLHYKRMPTTGTEVVLEDLDPFAKYNIYIESRNMKGGTNTTIHHKYVCSTLLPPKRVVFSGIHELTWDEVPAATSYRIETKKKTSDHFVEMAEVARPFYHMPGELMPLDVRIRSLRPPYEPSIPSANVHFGRAEANLYWIIIGGIMMLLTFCCCFLAHNSWKAFKRRRKRTRGKSHVRPVSSQPHTESFYEPTEDFKIYCDDNSSDSGDDRALRLDNGDSRYWTGPRDDPLIDLPPMEYDYDIGDEDFETGSTSAIDDMFRTKYIFNSPGVSPQLIHDLHIEKLRREYKQSHI